MRLDLFVLRRTAAARGLHAPFTTLALLVMGVAFAGCSTVVDRITNPWGTATERSTVPADATAYTCNGNKPLYVRYGPSSQYAMLIYPDREFRLDADKSGAGKFTNGRTTLTVSSTDASVEEGGAAVYAGCKRTAKAS